jgi:drug/metabolite transporter (DMT)-like permease
MNAAAPLKATLTGLAAVLMWAALALLTALAGPVPPFQLAAMSFTLATGLALAWWLAHGEAPARLLRQPPSVWALGVGGLFGYHALYFTALQKAPVVEASLIAYLWPLLIVLFSAFLPRHAGGGDLRWFHVAGALAGFAGAALIVTGGAGPTIRAEFAPGYAAAAGCALTWSTYSVLSRLVAHVPSGAVGGFCAVSAVLAWASHLAFETTVWPSGAVPWLAVAGLGAGPVGLAFFAWDVGVKRGDIRVLGAAAYAAPLLSTLLLIATGRAPASWPVAAAAVLIVGGGILAAQETLFRHGGRRRAVRQSTGRTLC